MGDETQYKLRRRVPVELKVTCGIGLIPGQRQKKIPSKHLQKYSKI
jgi:hypothetical protein